MKCPKIEAIQSKTRGRLGHFCNNSVLDYEGKELVGLALPFENDTSRVVKKLAKQDIKANKRTSISIMVAILIASTFLCALFTFVQS